MCCKAIGKGRCMLCEAAGKQTSSRGACTSQRKTGASVRVPRPSHADLRQQVQRSMHKNAQRPPRHKLTCR